MISRPIFDYVTLVSGSSFSSPVSYQIKQQQRRLEAIYIDCNVPDSTTVSAPTSESWGNVIKNVTLSVNDVSGSRNLVDASGIALLEEWASLGGSLPWQTLACIGNQLTTAQTNRRIIYPIFIRHPQMEEPWGNLFSVPLYDVRDNPVITVTPGTATEVGTGFAFGANTRIRLIFQYRDVKAGDYIPTEIKSGNFDSLAAASTSDLEIPSNGLLMSALLQGYTTSAKTTRRDLTGDADHSIKLYYGRELLRNTNLQFLSEYQEFTNTVPGYVAAGTTSPGLTGLAGRAFIDLFDDQPLIGGYSLFSCLNLQSIRANGDVAKITIDKTHASGIFVRMTTRKALGGPLDKIYLA